MSGKFVRAQAAVCLLGLMLVAAVGQAAAADLYVDCSGTSKQKIKTITAALNQLPKQGPNTIHISGTCNENVMIGYQNWLTLTGSPDATIKGVAITDYPALGIAEANYIYIEKLTVIPAEGQGGIHCGQLAFCIIRDVTVESNSNAGVGITFHRAGGALRDKVVVENVGGSGVHIYGSDVSISAEYGSVAPLIQNNGGDGIVVDFGSNLALMGGTVQNNGGNGIYADTNSTLRVVPWPPGTSISNNAGDGISLRSSSAKINGSTITGNGGVGVGVGSLSFVRFVGDNITGNLGGPDVLCRATTSTTDGAQSRIGGGSTNCTDTTY